MLITLFATPGRKRWLIGTLAIGALALLRPLLDRDLGRIYGSRAEVIAAQKAQRYVLVGTFGRPDWPAIVVGREVGDGTVSFVTADGQPQRYQGFSGPMKALEYRAGLTGGKAFTLVFHQVKPAPAGNPAFRDIR